MPFAAILNDGLIGGEKDRLGVTGVGDEHAIGGGAERHARRSDAGRWRSPYRTGAGNPTALAKAC